LVDSPDEIVAQGAAVYAATRELSILPGLRIVNVNSHSLGVSGFDPDTQQAVNKIVIRRNTPLPASVQKKFVTRTANQPTVSVRLLEGESENPRYCNQVAECIVELQPNLPERTEILVTLRYGMDGTISVSATVPLTRQSAHVEISHDGVNELDPLPTWKNRLLKGEEPASRANESLWAPAPIADPAAPSLAELVKRSDYLYRQIGENCLSTTVPPHALASQRAGVDAQNEVELSRRLGTMLQEKLSRAAHRHERLALQEDIAVMRAYSQNAENYYRQLLIALGRECYWGGTVPGALQESLDELRAIETRIYTVGEAAGP
jgi:molecular chaperone DnaK